MYEIGFWTILSFQLREAEENWYKALPTAWIHLVQLNFQSNKAIKEGTFLSYSSLDLKRHDEKGNK